MDELVKSGKFDVYNIEPAITPTSPLTRTPHPVNPHQTAEDEQMNKVGVSLWELSLHKSAILQVF